jgi:hypothetical protein
LRAGVSALRFVRLAPFIVESKWQYFKMQPGRTRLPLSALREREIVRVTAFQALLCQAGLLLQAAFCACPLFFLVAPGLGTVPGMAKPLNSRLQ